MVFFSALREYTYRHTLNIHSRAQVSSLMSLPFSYIKMYPYSCEHWIFKANSDLSSFATVGKPDCLTCHKENVIYIEI